MDLKDLANALVAANTSGNVADLLEQHYAEDIVSVEAVGMGDLGPETHGMEALKGKHAWWEANMETLSSEVSGPYLHGDDRFAVIFSSRIKDKNTGKIDEFTEVAIYHVAAGKIAREEFYYTF